MSEISSSGMSKSDKEFVNYVVMPLNNNQKEVDQAAKQAGDPGYTNPGTTDAPDDSTDVQGGW